MVTYNSRKYLERCLDSFERQSFDDWELVCVDRGSLDGTLEILGDRSLKFPKLRVLRGGDERTSQINIGVSATQSEYIYYTASDFEVDDHLLRDAVAEAERTKADAVFITNVSYGSGFWARVRNLERTTYIGTVKFEGVRFFRRSAYLHAGGYADDIPIFEEYDLQDRLTQTGAVFGRIEGSVERHLGEPESLWEIWTKSYYYGQRYLDYLRRRGRKAVRHMNPLRSSFLRHWRLFAAQPLLSGGFLLMLSVKYAGGAAGFLTAMARAKLREKSI